MNADPFQQLIKEQFLVEAVDLNRLAELVTMFNRCSQAMIGEDDFSLDEYKLEYQVPGFNLEESTRVVYTPDNQPVGVVEIWDHDPVPVHPYIWALVDPEWEGKGIGSAMMTWALERSRQALERVPADLRVSVRSSVTANYQPARELLEDFGMTQIRQYLRMVIKLDEAPPEPDWPAGITLRPFRPEVDAEAVYRAEDEAFRDHWGYVEQPFDVGFKEWKHFTLNHPDFDPTLWFIAMDGDDVAALARCVGVTSNDPDMGWVNVLGVRRPWRRRGLGLALLRHSFCVLHQRGKTSAGLGVDSTSLTGATDLYERAGMHTARITTSYELELRKGIESMTESIPT